MSVMKKSERDRSDLAGVVEKLRSLADQIENEKKVNVGDLVVSLPENIETKIKYKLKDDRSKFSIKLQWYDDEGKESSETRKIMNPETIAIPSKLKEMKKLMEESLFNLELSLKKEHVIDSQNAKNFKRTVDNFRARQNPKWQSALDELENETNRLLENLEKNELSLALNNIKNIWDQKEKCHELFK